MPQRVRLPPLREALGYEAAPDYFDTLPRNHQALRSRPDDYAGYPASSAYVARPAHPATDPFQMSSRSGASRSLRDDPALNISYTPRDPWTSDLPISPPPRGRKQPLHSSMQRTPSPLPRGDYRDRTQKVRRMSPPLSREHSLRDQSPPSHYSQLLPSQRYAQQKQRSLQPSQASSESPHRATSTGLKTPDLSSLSLDHMSEDEAPVRGSSAARSSVSPPLRSPRGTITGDTRMKSPSVARFMPALTNTGPGLAISSPFNQSPSTASERSATGRPPPLPKIGPQDLYFNLSPMQSPLSIPASSSRYGRRASEPAIDIAGRAASLPPIAAASPYDPTVTQPGTYPATGTHQLPLLPLRSPSPPPLPSLRSARSTHFRSPPPRLPQQPFDIPSPPPLHKAVSSPRLDHPISSTSVKYVCEVCGKAFARPSGLSIHMVVHTGERAYQCSQCMRSFGTASNLRRHQKLHQEDLRRLASP